MDPYEMIKAHLGKAVPYATHTGVELLEIGDGMATARLAQRPETENHIKGQHAGAMFTLGEAASGAAVAGILAPVISQMRPVAAMAEITYRKFAQGTLVATATASRSGPELLAALNADGKVTFDVIINIRDAEGDSVVEMKINWYVSPTRN
jgi:acyl-coenzyme A thioesterase PaaI-like protein